MATQRFTWDEMQAALTRARGRALDIVSAICDAPDRETAAAAVSEIARCDREIADQLLDARLNEFIASSRSA